MDTPFDLPDPSDWLPTPLSLLAPVENSLRCQVCKDFFHTPMITSCAHTFCSLCIRRCLSAEGKCPTCRTSDQELRLRMNWALQEVVESFRNARPSVLGLARQGQGERSEDEPAGKKRKVDHGGGKDAVGDSVEEGRRTRSWSKRDRPTETSAVAEVVEDIQDDEYIPDDGLVACPVCNRRMKNEAVFQHLDTCAGNPAPSKKQASFGSLQPMSRARKPGNANQPPERLPIINYSCLKDGALRKKFRELGIPDWGPRDLLQRRHLEWMNLWNANCDAENRKPKRELLQELDIWERTQGGLSSMASSGPTNTVMRKDFDKDAWSTTHGNDFKKLIANAQKSNDASVRSTIPKVNKQDDVPNEPERIPVPDQSIDGVSEAPAPTGSFEKLGELPVDASVNGFVENMAQASQELGDIQTVNPPSENVSSQCSATR